MVIPRVAVVPVFFLVAFCLLLSFGFDYKMRVRSFVAAAVAFATTSDAHTQHILADAAAIAAAKTTAKTLSPTSSVPGKTFDRFVNIWLENTDYDMAAGDPSLAWLATQGITLTNYLALTHPSQPNYIAAVGGSTHWVLGDWFTRISSSERTIVDLLDAKGISWSEYEEDMPYSGFQGDYINQINGANDYVRKHNPLISYDSVTEDEDRLAKIKNLTMFYEDLDNNALPQWMFITPNMTSDGHDSSVTVAGTWTENFLEPLLTNENFMNNTLVLLTFDETESYLSNNRVFSLLLGDVIPDQLRNTKDDKSYNHYSIMATVENNWDLGNLGLKDKTASVFF